MSDHDETAGSQNAFDEEARQVLAVGAREEKLRRRYPIESTSFERTRMAPYTAYAAMVLEGAGWRQMFPAQPSEDEARLDLAAVLRQLTAHAPAGARYAQAAEAVENGADQIIIGERVYRIVRVEQTVIMTEYGPEPPQGTDSPFPEEFDDRESEH
ncbi:DUF5954 family protein [Streptomyces sp. A 4/2]|uniref:DUF5954 family protein n=1 Tax=Streptomyces sp. A 4/2 TaxID=2934314 RepID=UPI002024017A|nr:DUF5954 family protein [Streptomyces sp. A 4/2]